MKIRSLTFMEFAGTPREWSVGESEFGDINLIVGRNASGKTRLVNVIAGLAKMLKGQVRSPFPHTAYDATFQSNGIRTSYQLSTGQNEVTSERLMRDNRVLLDRGKGGVGKIFAAQLNREIDFQSPPSSLAAAAKVDQIQHPFLTDLLEWSQRLRMFEFGTPLGRDYVLTTPLDVAGLQEKNPDLIEANRVGEMYLRAWGEYGESFDQAILQDLEALGYPAENVGLHDIPSPVRGLPPMLSMYVKEKDLSTPTEQIFMSQGMFRALSLVVSLNAMLFRKVSRTIIVDDIGEGLDYVRAQSFISLLIAKAKESDLQLIMTTNDRFIMNGVPLDYWSVIQRNGNRVRVFNKHNSPDVFADFEALGLSNFDFFSSNFFETGFTKK